jgi:hypothetical protein
MRPTPNGWTALRIDRSELVYGEGSFVVAAAKRLRNPP